MSIIKWLWDKAEERATERILAELSWRRQYHLLQAEIAYSKDRYEPERDRRDDMFMMKIEPKISAKEHGLIADELRNIIRATKPEEN